MLYQCDKWGGTVRVSSAVGYRQIHFRWRWRVGHTRLSMEFVVTRIHLVSSAYIVTTLQVVGFIASGFLHVTVKRYLFSRTLTALYECFVFRGCPHVLGHLLRCEGIDLNTNCAFCSQLSLAPLWWIWGTEREGIQLLGSSLFFFFSPNVTAWKSKWVLSNWASFRSSVMMMLLCVLRSFPLSAC